MHTADTFEFFIVLQGQVNSQLFCEAFPGKKVIVSRIDNYTIKIKNARFNHTVQDQIFIY
jgi:hypothetical protein